jgi:hypothetical protein
VKRGREAEVGSTQDEQGVGTNNIRLEGWSREGRRER